MSSLIDNSSEKLTFKNWVEQHNPHSKWNWDDPKNVKCQLSMMIALDHSLDLKTVFHTMFGEADSGLTEEQNLKFLGDNY